MSVAPARNWRRQNWTSILQQVRYLFLQIDLDRRFRAQQRGCAEKCRNADDNPHASFKLARRVKVAEVISGEHRPLACSNRLLAECNLHITSFSSHEELRGRLP